VVALALTAVTFHPVCDLVFDCGCRWVFAGGADHCDIRVPGPPDCPPCANWGIGAVFGAVLLGGWLVLLRLGRRLLPVKEAR
jgi:hypothetical protein